jgi:hypothetical protein
MQTTRDLILDAMSAERMADFMPRWPKPHIKPFHPRPDAPLRYVVIFTNPRYPHTRYWTGHHAFTVAEAWAHLPVMCAWHSCPLPDGVSGEFSR